MKIGKSIVYSCLLVCFITDSMLTMEPDLNDAHYSAIKQQFLEASLNDDLLAFENSMKKFNDFAKHLESELDKSTYLKDLLFSSNNPNNRSMVDIIISKENFACLDMLIAATVDNPKILYMLLEECKSLFHRDYFFTSDYMKPSTLDRLFTTQNPAIYYKVNELMSRSMNRLIIIKLIDQLIEFLHHLINNTTIDKNRLTETILITLADSPYESVSSLISKLQEKKVLLNFNKDDYIQCLTLYEIIRNFQNHIKQQKLPALKDYIKTHFRAINLKDLYGDSLLIHVARAYQQSNEQGIFELISWLVTDQHADVNQPGEAGKTILMLIAGSTYGKKLKTQKDLVNFLINEGNADINAEDISGKTALDYSKEAKNKKIMSILEQYTIPRMAKLSLREKLLILNNLDSSLCALANKKNNYNEAI